mgnify:CR=1 FL=1
MMIQGKKKAGKRTVSRETLPSGLLGNTDREKDGIFRILPVTGGVYPSALHQSESFGDGVQEQTDIL